MVITGQVQEIDASARVITFVEPVHGLSTVALLPDTEVVAADGSPKDLRDIKPGMLIQVAGGAGGNGAVLARTIRILTGPTPLS